MRPVLERLQARGVRLIDYLDNIILMVKSPETVLTHLEWRILLLQDLGFVINVQKTVLVVAQRLDS